MLLDKWRRVTAIGRLIRNTTRYCLRRSVHGVVSLRKVDCEGIEISWDDKQKDYYHGIWLRHNCQCPLCLEENSGQKTVEPIELVNSRVTKATVMSSKDHVHVYNTIITYSGY